MTKSNTVKKPVAYLDCEKYQAESFDFMAAYLRVKECAQCDAVEDSKAFAFYWTLKEAMALGKDPRRAASDDPALAAELSLRQLQWGAARLEWHLLFMRKRCPAAFDETVTPGEQRAAELGIILGDKSERTTDRLKAFIERRCELSEREHRIFLQTALNNKPADWRHPELDTWLMLAWPIVDRFKWEYRDVLNAVHKKFPGQRGYPFDSVPSLTKHCSGLGLRTVRPHPKKAPLLELVQEISTEVDLLRRLGFLEK
jgi:hypothetical protein